MKKPFIVCNWKLNGDKNVINNFVKNIKLIDNIKNMQLTIAPPVIYLDFFKNLITEEKFFLAAQDVDIHENGAFTGEVSAAMLKDIGVKYIIIGHSERKIFHNENNEIILKKISMAIKFSLIPIVCIGETLQQHKEKKTKEVCLEQINYLVNNNIMKNCNKIIIAYEPIWAIGTGKSAEPKEIQILIKFMREHINKFFKISKKILMLYGGSVNKKNAKVFLNQSDIDGLLVGKASLNTDFFYSI